MDRAKKPGQTGGEAKRHQRTGNGPTRAQQTAGSQSAGVSMVLRSRSSDKGIASRRAKDRGIVADERGAQVGRQSLFQNLYNDNMILLPDLPFSDTRHEVHYL